MNFRHTTPESYDGAPVTLVAPAADRCTPPDVSIRFLRRISALTDLAMLERCGRFPIEEPGLTQLREAMRATLSVGGGSWVRVRRKSDSTRSRGDVTTDAIYW